MAQQERLQSLDSLRGIGALAVMTCHATSVAFGGVDGTGILLITRRGYLAVDLFFILSGFVLAHVHGPEFSNQLKPGRHAAFMWARFARIYPVHLLSILLLLQLYGQSPLYSGHALALNLLLLQGPWLPHTTWNEPSWSISAEWHAYILFPILCAALWRLPAKAAVAVALACAFALVLTCAKNEWSVAYVTAGPLILGRALPEFIAGILVYRVYRCGSFCLLWRSDRFFAAMVISILALSAVWPTDFVIILLLPGLLLAVATNESGAKSLLNARPLRFLGDISYSLYMVHYICLTVVFGRVDVTADSAITSKIIAFFATVILSLAMATLVSRRIEYPARSLLRALWRKSLWEKAFR